ncbi:unnamed protein product, partial [Aureobasidium pullulans]
MPGNILQIEVTSLDMAPQLAPLARSDSKTKFFQRLGLSPERKSDNRLYELMKDEAVQGRERILSSPNSLLPQLRGDPDIYREASPETKTMYEKGHDTESFNEENWIIRWMLCKSLSMMIVVY